MNCSEAHPLIHAYTDGELDLVRSLDVEQHLSSCPRCIAVRDMVLSLRTALRNADVAYRAPESLRRNIQWAIRESDAEKNAPAVTAIWWKWLAAGATAFAVITLLLQPGGVTGRNQVVDEAIDNHVRSLLASHLTDVTSTDQHTVKPWFNGRVDFAPNVKDFAAQGYPLIGGRLDYLSGHRVAALIYQRNKHFINVFVWPTGAIPSPQPDTESRRGYSVINRDENGMHYCLVSDLNMKELSDLAGMLGD